MSIFSTFETQQWLTKCVQHAKDNLKVNDIMNQLCVPKFRHFNAFEMPKFRHYL